MLALAFVYIGLVVILIGGISVVKPPAFAGIHRRLQGAFLLGLGLLMASVGFSFPVKEARVAMFRTQLDRFTPVYQFNEIHSIRVAAPRDRVYQAVKGLTADEILFFRTLTWLRRLGRPGPESILNPPERCLFLRLRPGRDFCC